MIFILVINLVGPLVCLHALPYMDNHEKELGLTKSAQPRFFAVLVMFLGAMNGLVLTNDLNYFYFFFEVTTVSSFLLINHDRTEIAVKNSLRALWMTSLGGAALLIGIIWLGIVFGTLELQAVIKQSPGVPAALLPLALLCIAGFTKAAQMPFQSWLLGAMVAPTPTSALLHSSTMVKAGVYLVVRMAPAFTGTFLSLSVGLFGAFTFVAAAALAVGQSNGKKILAYSTISNLGLIFACAGLNSPEAMVAAMFLILYHAFSKALLFLCVGTIEQQISSREVEKMRGLFVEMPVTAVILVMGVMTMILPPFGMLLGKWMAIESAALHLPYIVVLALGSAMTTVYWAKWAGIIMDAPWPDKLSIEPQKLLTRAPLVLLLGAALVLGFGALWLYQSLIAPIVGGYLPFEVREGYLQAAVGAFAVFPLFVIAALSFILGLYGLMRSRRNMGATPYMCGVQTDDPDSFRGPMNKTVKLASVNFYLPTFFSEQRLTPSFNFIATVLLVLLLGDGL